MHAVRLLSFSTSPRSHSPAAFEHTQKGDVALQTLICQVEQVTFLIKETFPLLFSSSQAHHRPTSPPEAVSCVSAIHQKEQASMQEGMKGNKILNRTKIIFLPLLHTLLAWSTGVQTPENPSLLQGSAIQLLWSDTGAENEMTKGSSPTYSSSAPS